MIISIQPIESVHIGTGCLWPTERYQSKISHWSVQYWVPIVHFAPQQFGFNIEETNDRFEIDIFIIMGHRHPVPRFCITMKPVEHYPKDINALPSNWQVLLEASFGTFPPFSMLSPLIQVLDCVSRSCLTSREKLTDVYWETWPNPNQSLRIMATDSLFPLFTVWIVR